MSSSQDFGFFDKNKDEYVVTNPSAPRPQENYLFNNSYFSCVHQTGYGFSSYTNKEGYYTSIITGDTQPANNECSRIVYIKDNDTGEIWNLGYYPLCRTPDKYECRHGAGYTCIKSTYDNIIAELRIFVPYNNDPIELWTLKLHSSSVAVRNLSVFVFVPFSLQTNAFTYGHEVYLNSILLPEYNCVAAKKPVMDLPHNYYSALLMSSIKPDSMDGDKNAFIEQFRTLANPIAVERGYCSNTISSRGPIAGAMHFNLTISKNNIWRSDFLVGAADVYNVEGSAKEYFVKYLSDSGKSIDNCFLSTKKYNNEFLENVKIDIGDYKFNTLFNQWIPLLIKFGITAGRWGLLGYRDVVQHTQGFLMFSEADKIKMRMCQALSNQYKSGYAVRSFPAALDPTKYKYADSGIWLIYCVVEYLKEYGDMAFLDKKIPFLDDNKPKPVIDHLVKIVDVLWTERGSHGFCLIYQGDWNDSLTHVGIHGKGESVWLSQSFCLACLYLEELFIYLNDSTNAELYRGYYQEMKMLLNKNGWDGEWYIRAFDDNGSPIGSRINKEGRVFLNTQSWAMMSGTVSEERIKVLNNSINKHLFTPYGYMLLYPTYTHKCDNIGRLTCVEPGCNENASVYTHSNAFLIVGLLKSNLPDLAFDLINRIMPYNPKNPSSSVIPFQLTNGYGGIDHRTEPGKILYGWVTGSGAWLHQAVIEYMFGLNRTFEGLIINPCLPEKLKNVKVSRRYRSSMYEVEYIRNDAKSNKVKRILVNNKKHGTHSPLPLGKNKKFEVKVIF